MLAGQALLGVGERQRNQRHRSRALHGTETAGPVAGDPRAVGQIDDAGDDAGGDLADGVPDHRGRRRTTGAQHRRQPDLHREGQGLHLIGAAVLAAGQRRAGGEAEFVTEYRVDGIDDGGEFGFLAQQLGAHAHPVRAVSGTHPDRPGTGAGYHRAGGHRGVPLTAGQRVQADDEFLVIRGDDGRAHRLVGAPRPQGARDIGQ